MRNGFSDISKFKNSALHQRKKIIYLEVISNIKSLPNESNFIDKEAMRSRKIN